MSLNELQETSLNTLKDIFKTSLLENSDNIKITLQKTVDEILKDKFNEYKTYIYLVVIYLAVLIILIIYISIVTTYSLRSIKSRTSVL